MHRDDKVTDVLAVLTAINNGFNNNGFKSGLYGRDCTELRKNAVIKVAEAELRIGRYKNMDSAQKTIHDACARRLRPAVASIKKFERLTDQWLFRNSADLETIIKDHSESVAQQAEVTRFFREQREPTPVGVERARFCPQKGDGGGVSMPHQFECTLPFSRLILTA
jgi:hypothetical protein